MLKNGPTLNEIPEYIPPLPPPDHFGTQDEDQCNFFESEEEEEDDLAELEREQKQGEYE